MQPEPQREWKVVLPAAQFRVSEGKFDVADSLLQDFASRYPGTTEAAETAYWRALIRMDPSNQHGSLQTAVTSLDTYLADRQSREHIREAAALRRVAIQLDGLNKATAALPRDLAANSPNTKPQPGDLRVDLARPATEMSPYAEAEIKRLKDELAKATAELERIRKRLAQPPHGNPDRRP
jgi:outer membrane protein assembly factor BamD (BamD/ComL family)